MLIRRDDLEFKLYEWLYRGRQGNAEAPAQIRQLEWELAIVDQAIANTYRSLGEQLYEVLNRKRPRTRQDVVIYKYRRR
jgi:hypothetical protein